MHINVFILNRMKRLIPITLLVTLFLTSCLKDDVDTLVLPPLRYALPIGDVVPSDILSEIEKYMPIYEGDTPPEIEGVYVINPNELVVASAEDLAPGIVISNDTVKFSNQNAKTNVITFERKQKTENEFSDFVSLVGSDNNFTAYFNADGTTTEGINYKTATVISGTMTANGIKDYYKAFIITEKDADPNKVLFPAKAFRIFKDGNALAENTSW